MVMVYDEENSHCQISHFVLLVIYETGGVVVQVEMETENSRTSRSVSLPSNRDIFISN